MTRDTLLVGTHRRAHHADPADIAFGIYSVGTDAATRDPAVLTETPQPGWIAAHPHLPLVYAVNEVKVLDGAPGGSVSAFRLHGPGRPLEPVNSRATPPMPCHCAVDADGRFLLVATFGGGSVHLFALDADGAIGAEVDAHRHVGSSVHPRRQTSPHAHAVAIDPANRFVLVPDLGIDRLLVYELDGANGRLVPRPDRTVALPPAAGPRHVAFDPAGRRAYLMNEMSATVVAFDWDGEGGTLHPIQTVDLLPDGFAGLRSGAAILVAPSGRHLYATTRSHGSSGMPPQPGLDALVWFAIDPDTGQLHFEGRLPSGGEIPRAAVFRRGGRKLLIAHQASGAVSVFAVDPATGRPRPTGETIAVPVPVCLCPLEGAWPAGS